MDVQGLAEVCDKLNVEPELTLPPDEAKKAILTWINSAFIQNIPNKGFKLDLITPYIHILRDHVWEYSKVLHRASCQAVERENLKDIRLWNSTNSRRGEKERELLGQSLRISHNPQVSSIERLQVWRATHKRSQLCKTP